MVDPKTLKEGDVVVSIVYNGNDTRNKNTLHKVHDVDGRYIRYIGLVSLDCSSTKFSEFRYATDAEKAWFYANTDEKCHGRQLPESIEPVVINNYNIY